MAEGTMEITGTGTVDVPLGSLTSITLTISSPPGMSASNSPTGEYITYEVTKQAAWWFFGTAWTATVTWDVQTPRVISYSTRNGLLAPPPKP